MADDQTRTEVVTANIEAAESKYGSENFEKQALVCLKDISVSLAMLVDASGGGD